MSTIVIYHKADFDGIFSREIAKLFFKDAAEYIGWDYGDPLPCIPPHNADGTPAVDLYMIDISVDGLMDYPGLIWIDHHKSAMEKFSPSIKGYRIDGVAACRLAWQWFFTYNDSRNPLADNFAKLPVKQDFIDRKVQEPISVRLAGEYDIWDKRDPRAELFQHGLRSRELSDNLWSLMLTLPRTEGDKQDVGTITVDVLLDAGEALQYAQTHQNASIIKAYGFTVQFEGLTFLACNHARFNSHLFTAGIKPEHDALLGFNYDGAGKWRVSLYHAPEKTQHDLSQIAVKYGGGGHRGACGFKAEKLPFLP